MRNNQNIFDNESFFEGYKNLRESTNNYNVLMEQPIFDSLLPDLKDKTVLDIGCGAGDSCIKYEKLGAKKIVGIDVSKKMLEEAKKKTQSKKIEFLNVDMCDIESIKGKFDIITSSLAIHYVKDFNALIKSAYNKLNNGGYFIFSQEHPFTTAPYNDVEFTFDEKGKVKYYHLSDYMRSGKRKCTWFVENIEKYHRTFSEILNVLIENNFIINKVEESKPTQEAVAKNPHMIKEFDKPSFLFIKSVKS